MDHGTAQPPDEPGTALTGADGPRTGTTTASRPGAGAPGGLPARRSLLAVAGSSALLAACSSTDDGTDDAGGSSASSAPAASSSSSAATSSASAGGSAAADAIVALADVPVGGAVAAKLDGKPIIVAQPTAGTVKAFSAACTHSGCTVEVDGAKLDCPCHGSVFDALTGAVEKAPATKDLPSIAVAVSGSSVVSA